MESNTNLIEKLPDVSLHCISTPDSEPMLIRFLSGLEESVSVTCHPCALPGERGVGGGEALWRYKTQLMIEASTPVARERQNNASAGEKEIFVIFSDIDIALYRPIRQILPDLMAECDLCFQREWLWENRQANIGFIVFRRTAAVKAFWREVLQRIEAEGLWDQEVVNHLIRDDAFLQRIGLRTGLLPPSFWAYSHGALPSAPCVLHHANCAGSFNRKWAQLSTYRPLFEPVSTVTRRAFETISRQFFDHIWLCGKLGRRTPLGSLAFSADGRLSTQFGKFDIERATVTEQHIVLHRAGEKLFCVLEEFYVDRHRGRMLCVGRLCPMDYIAAPRRQGYFWLSADLDAEGSAAASSKLEISHKI